MVSAAQSFFSPDQAVSGQRTKLRYRDAVAWLPNLHIPSLALATALAYYFGTKFGYLFTPASTPIGTLWPPNAILLAALLLTPTRVWGFLLLAVLPAHLFAQLRAGVPPIAPLGWFCSTAGAPLAGSACIC